VILLVYIILVAIIFSPVLLVLALYYRLHKVNQNTHEKGEGNMTVQLQTLYSIMDNPNTSKEYRQEANKHIGYLLSTYDTEISPVEFVKMLEKLHE